MKAVVLAAGSGRRMWPYAEVRCKAMLPVANQPVARHLVRALREGGVDEILFLAGPFASDLAGCLRDEERVQVLDVGTTDGTAQTLLHAQQWAKGTFLAVYGDVLLSGEDVRRLAQCEAPWAALVSPLDGDRTGDHICARVQDGQIVRIVGHPREGDCRRLAAFRLDESVFPLLACCPSFFPDVEVGMMPPREKHLESVLLQKGPLPAVECGGFDLDKPWHLLRANRACARKICTELDQSCVDPTAYIDPSASIAGKVRLGRGSRIGRNVVIEGNCVIGDNTVLDNGAIVRENCVIGNDCRLINGCYVSDGSVVGDRCVIGHGAELDGVLFRNVYLYHYMEIYGMVGENTDFGAGTVCGSLRFDDGECVHRINGRKEVPSYDSAAVYVGDFCRTGVNAILSPGKRIGVYSVVGAGTILTQDVPNHTLIYARQELVTQPWDSTNYGW